MRDLFAFANTPAGTRAVSSRILGLRRHIPFLALALVLGVTIAGSGPALSALPSGAAVTTARTFGSTITLPRPTTTTAGDVLVASIDARLSGTATIAPPSGWVLIRRDSSAPGYRSLSQALYYKLAGSSEPASYRWTLASSVSAAGAILDLKGINPSSPIDSHSGAFTPKSSSFTAPSVTTTSARDVVLGFFGTTSSKSIQPPAALTEEFDIGWWSRSWSLDAEGAAYVQASAGATGNRTASTSSRPPSWTRPSCAG